MPIPRTRAELVEQVEASFAKLRAELADGGAQLADRPCVDEWSVKDLLAVRAWWTESVVGWIEAGRRGESPVTPAPGYRWKETPRLNADLVREARDESFAALVARLHRAYERVRATIEALDDRELLEVGVFAWAGNYPISRWLSLNTARQYTTARTFVRRARRNAS